MNHAIRSNIDRCMAYLTRHGYYVTGQFMTLSQVAALFGVTTAAIKRWEEDPEMNFPTMYRFGTRVNYKASDIQIWIETRKNIHMEPRNKLLPRRKHADTV